MLQIKQTSTILRKIVAKSARDNRERYMWVALSSLYMFSKEIWKNGTRGHGHNMFASAKGKQQK